MSSPLDDMYREIILDHFRAPRGHTPLEKSDISSDGSNPSCGDVIEVNVAVDGDTIKDIHVDCKGCAISIASGSMLAETIKGKSIAEVEKIAEAVAKMLKGECDGLPDDLNDISDLEDLDSLGGVRQFPVRIKCALLAWVTLAAGLQNYHNGQKTKVSVSTEEDD